MSERNSRRNVLPSRFGVLVSAVGLVAFASCGGDGGDTSGLPDALSTAAPQATNPAGGSSEPVAQTFTVNQEFWHIGFHVELGDGMLFSAENALSQEVTYFLSMDATFENLGDGEITFDSPMVIVADGNNYSWDRRGDVPSVPGGLSGTGTIEFVVEGDLDVSSALLIVGEAGDNQAKVPLGAQGGELVTLAPSEPPVTGSVSMELLDFTFNSAGLRADLLGSHRQLEAGKWALTLNFDVTSRKSGNWSIFASDFALVLPDGSGIGADGSVLENLPGSDQGTLTSGLSLRFLVDDPPAGDYTLRFTPGSWFIGEDGVTEVTFDFTLP